MCAKATRSSKARHFIRWMTICSRPISTRTPPCAPNPPSKIYFTAPAAKYPPPVIYSLDERNKLVYLIQARPSRPDSLRVGQPVSVFLGAKTPVADKQ